MGKLVGWCITMKKGKNVMSKKLNHAQRVYRELLDRYGEDDVHVRQLRGELEVMESVEFRHAGRAHTTGLGRTTGAHRRRMSAHGAA